jgi:hypothetical protein
MVNWHRKIFKIQAPPAGSSALSNAFFKPGGTNEIWFVPVAAVGEGRTCFTVGFDTDQAGPLWKGWFLFDEGTEELGASPAVPGPSTRRLEGERVVGADLKALRVFIQLEAGIEHLIVKIGPPGDPGDQGIAIGHEG